MEIRRNTDQRINNLPDSLKPIAEHLGYGAAARLVEVFPGYRLHIPHHVRQGHVLRSLGDDIAEELAKIFAGETIEVPTRLLSFEARDRIIRELAAQVPRIPVNEIAGRAGTTRRHVARVLARDPNLVKERRARPADPRQVDIFAFLEDGATAQAK